MRDEDKEAILRNLDPEYRKMFEDDMKALVTCQAEEDRLMAATAEEYIRQARQKKNQSLSIKQRLMKMINRIIGKNKK